MLDYGYGIRSEDIRGALRREREIGQNELAGALGLSNASVSYWETGKQIPSAEAVYKLARFFGVTADYLLGLSDY